MNKSQMQYVTESKSVFLIAEQKPGRQLPAFGNGGATLTIKRKRESSGIRFQFLACAGGFKTVCTVKHTELYTNMDEFYSVDNTSINLTLKSLPINLQ